MKDLKQNIIDALSDATDFEYDKVNTSIFHEYLDDIFDQIPDNESALTKRVEELEAMLEKCKSLFDQRQLPYERDCVEFSKEITELLNKK